MNTWRPFSLSFESIFVDKFTSTLWLLHRDEQVLLEAFGGKEVDLKIIQPKTTKYAQPPDVYFFRQYKIYAKRITDFIKLRSRNMQQNCMTDSLS